MRLEILILITEFGLSCYQAARVLNLPYTNAKVIYRIFREENRVTSNSKGKNPYGLSESFLVSHAYIMRQDALRKLDIALKNGSMTCSQRSKIYDHNFDEFLTKPVLTQFEQEGIYFIGDHFKNLKSNERSLPIPTNFTNPAP